MFSVEREGYSKEEVDAYISKLKQELMEKKLSLLDSEQKVLDLKQKRNEIETKEKTIIKALKSLEEAQKIHEERSKNLYALRDEQSRLLSEKVQSLISYINTNHPEIKNDSDIADLINQLDEINNNVKNSSPSINSPNDSMRALLNKMQEYRRQKSEVKTIKIERNNIKHICEEAKNIDEFLATKPKENQLYKNVEIEANGFDLKEAVNPKEGLDEIMKAFDFFNNQE